MGVAKIRTTAIQFDPVDPSTLPVNSIYVDATNGESFSNKTSSGAEVTAATDAFAKMAKNISGVTIPANYPVSRMSDGSIIAADSDSANGQRPIGVTMQAIPNDTFGLIGLVGRNMAGALTSYGFAPGQDIYISQSEGYTADASTFTGDNDSIILIGIADCADNVMSSQGNDLILLRQILVRP